MELTYLQASFARALSLVRPAIARRFLALYFAAALLLIGGGGLFFSARAGGFAGRAVQCTPNSSYALPAALDLTSAADGLTIVDAGDSYYDVYGTDRGTIAAELNACAPRFNGIKTDATYLAYTSYNLTWQYGTTVGADGICRLADVKVGLHLSQIYPRYDSTDESSTLTQKWNAFIAGTEEHENGHLQIDKDLAGAMLTDLRGTSAPCSTIDAMAAATTTKYSNFYSSENHDHDTDTDYGRTQGASW